MTAILFYRQDGNLLTCCRERKNVSQVLLHAFSVVKERQQIFINFKLQFRFIFECICHCFELLFYDNWWQKICTIAWLLHFRRRKTLMWVWDDMTDRNILLLAKEQKIMESFPREHFSHFSPEKIANLFGTVLCVLQQKFVEKQEKDFLVFFLIPIPLFTSPVDHKSWCSA